jgi:hypothetical protein
MEPLHRQGTIDSPSIILDKANEQFQISGQSYPANVSSVYQPVMEWLDQYIAQPNRKTTLHLKFEYFNTASSKAILDILTKLEKLHKDGHEVLINWHYRSDDEEMLEGGEGYAELVDVPFTFTSYH